MTRIHVGSVAVLLAFSLTSGRPARALAQQSIGPSIDSIMAQYDHRDSPGCAVGVGGGARSSFMKGYGMADLERGVPISPTTVFHAASLSKQFTATAAALLSAQGKMNLDYPLGRYLPELKSPNAEITVRQALEHIGGLRDQWELLSAAGWRVGDDLVTDDDVLDIVSRQRALNFSPGSEYLYSNTGFTLVARIIQRLSGKPFDAYTSENIFGPLQMASTRFGGEHGPLVPGRGVGYAQAADGSWRLSSPHYSTVGATGLLTTVGDLLRWGDNFESGVVGGTGVRATLTTAALLEDGASTQYGLGLGLAPLGTHDAYRHSGSDPGFASYFLHLPAERLTVVILCNVSAAPTSNLAARIARVALGEPNPPVPALPWRAETDSSRLGWYWNSQRERLWQVVGADSGRLLASEDASLIQFRLRYIGDGRYRIGDGPAELEFGKGGELIQHDPSAAPTTTTYRQRPAWHPKPAEFQALLGRYLNDEVRAEYSLSMVHDSLVLTRPRQSALTLQPAFEDALIGAGTLVRVERRQGRPAALCVTRPRLRRLCFAKLD